MKHKPRVIRPYEKTPEPRMFGKASYASMAIIAALGLCAAMTQPDAPAVISHTAEQQRQLTALMASLEAEDRADARLIPAVAVKPHNPSSPEWWGLETCGKSKACLERFNRKPEKRR